MSITTYTPLEPKMTSGFGLPATTFQAGQASTLFASTSFIYSFLIILCVGATAFVYVRGGIWRMQASEAGIRKSNEEFKRGTLGLLGVLSLFLILYTFNRNLLLGDIRLSDLRTSPTIGQGGESGGGGATGNYSGNGAEILNSLNSAGITINHGNIPCTSSQLSPASTPPPCTSVDSLPQETVNMLRSLKSVCNCTVLITGGTEPGHSSHGPNLRPVDLQVTSDSDNLYSFIKRSGSVISNTAPCNIKYSWSGFTFWDENITCSSGNTGRHWHVS